MEKSDAINKIKELLVEIQHNLYNRAEQRRNTMLYNNVKSYDELRDIALNKTGFALVNWCGNVDCENKIKEDLGLKSRCIPFGVSDPDGNCVVCNKEASTKIYFGKQY